MPDPLTVASLYRLLPSVDKVLQSPALKDALTRYPRSVAVASARTALAQIRAGITVGDTDENKVREQVNDLTSAIAADMSSKTQFSLRRVINATGVILHTNLGRAPLSRSALDHISAVAADYSNLELDIDSGRRSRRDVHAEALILRLLGKKTGLQLDRNSSLYRASVVNNCAAATFLVLNSLADGGEVIVSRGELVEIGGGFRIPEILRKSGAILREVGTTNRTRLADYQSALSDRTSLILRVHQSNFCIQGFAERPSLGGLISLANKNNVPIFADQGTGLLASLGGASVDAESSFFATLKKGPDIIAASGDKLLGGPQCGIIVGKPDLMQKVVKNPLTRAFRVCKLTYAALEGTLMDYLTGNLESIPVTRMLALSSAEIRERCERLASSLKNGRLEADVVPAKSLIGGGTTPDKKLSSFAVAVRHASIRPEQLANLLRRSNPPVIPRIRKDTVLLDLRTVPPECDELLAVVLKAIDPEPARNPVARESVNGTT
jgi:L-seryl-tRNA(Ser) seleniumtransferase